MFKAFCLTVALLIGGEGILFAADPGFMPFGGIRQYQTTPADLKLLAQKPDEAVQQEEEEKPEKAKKCETLERLAQSNYLLLPLGVVATLSGAVLWTSKIKREEKVGKPLLFCGIGTLGLGAIFFIIYAATCMKKEAKASTSGDIPLNSNVGFNLYYLHESNAYKFDISYRF